MALLALSAASSYLLTGPVTLPVALPAAEAGVLTGNTGFTFPNDEQTVVRIVVGASGTGTYQVVPAFGAAPAAVTLANSTVYIFGPYPAMYNSASGLVQVNLSVVTGNTVGVYRASQYRIIGDTRGRPTHNPLQLVAGAADI